MDAALHSVTLWSMAAASALVNATWQGLLLTACIAICLRLLPGQRLLPAPSAAGRSLLWMAVFLVVVLLHFAPHAQNAAGQAFPGHAGLLHVSPLWGLAIACMWIFLSAHRLARLASGARRLRAIAQRATPLNQSQYAELLRGSRRPVEVCTSLDVDRPSVVGFRSPRILLPPALIAQLSAFDLEQVLLHEMEHLRRADDWTNLLQKLVLAIFPLDPALLWIERRLCTERELACDDGVLEHTHARKAYATCLTRLAEHSLVQRGTSLALGAWERQSELSQRVYRILLQPETAAHGWRAGLMTSLLGVALLAGAGELARSPQIIRFAPATVSTDQASAESLEASATARTTLRPSLRLATMVLPATQSRPRLIPASLSRPVPRSRRQVRRSTQARPLPRVERANLQETGATPQVPLPIHWLVLTSWEQGHIPREPSFDEQSDLPTSYAAVPVADGWLIIRL